LKCPRCGSTAVYVASNSDYKYHTYLCEHCNYVWDSRCTELYKTRKGDKIEYDL